MDKCNKILQSREEKNLFIQKYVNDYQVISLKANIPGVDKNIKEAYILITYFDRILQKYDFEKSFPGQFH